MTEVFADAFYYIALLNPADEFHAAAIQATQSLQQRLVATVWVMMEVGNALSSPSVLHRTGQFLQRVTSDPNIVVISDVEPWFERGLSLYGNRPDKSWSLTDCISFEVMAARHLRNALTGDRHFVQAGFRALLLPDGANA